MYCSECGKEVKGKVKFCPFCGTEQFEDNSTGQAVSEGRAAKEKQERTGSHFKIPIIAIAIIIVGMLLIGLRGEFGASLWEHKENTFDYSNYIPQNTEGPTRLPVYYGVRVGPIVLESEDECCAFIRNIGIILLFSGAIGAGWSINRQLQAGSRQPDSEE